MKNGQDFLDIQHYIVILIQTSATNIRWELIKVQIIKISLRFMPNLYIFLQQEYFCVFQNYPY